MSKKDPVELADAYLEALESKTDGARYEEARDRRDALQERLGQFEKKYGDSDPATQELREKVEAAGSRVAEIEQERQKPEEAERELLEAATGFMLNDEWLQPVVIKALNRALIGNVSKSLLIEEIEFQSPDDAEVIEDVDRYDVIDVVRGLAMDKLGDSEDARDVWRSIEGSTKEDPFRAVAELGTADTKTVVEMLDEDVDSGTVNNRLRNAVHHLDISPYHRDDGTYQLSTVGKYIAVEYAGVVGTEEETRNDEGPSEQGDDGQTTLMNGGGEADGGDADE
jgi:hypothetical protein